jgi:hypothetical protein
MQGRLPALLLEKVTEEDCARCRNVVASNGAGISTQTFGPGHGDVTITAGSIAMETVGNVLSMSTEILGMAWEEHYSEC